MKLKQWIKCKVFKHHNWTSAVMKGIKPTKEQLQSESGFFDYAKMYCEDCGKISELSKKLLCENSESK